MFPGDAPLRLGRVLVRRRHRHEPCPTAHAAGDPSLPWSRPALSVAALRRPADPELQEAGDDERLFREICRHNLLVNMLSDPASVTGRRRSTFRPTAVRRTRFDSRKVSGGGTLLADLAQLTCRIRLLWGRAGRLGVSGRGSPDRRDPLGRRATLDVHRIPAAGHCSAYENSAGDQPADAGVLLELAAC